MEGLRKILGGYQGRQQCGSSGETALLRIWHGARDMGPPVPHLFPEKARTEVGI
jgi:hypothetical protein